MAPGSLDLILCRNVIIYFDLPTIRALMDRFLNALRPGGLLFLGYSESLFKVYDRFEMIEVGGTFVYQRPVLDARGRLGLPPLPALTPPPGRLRAAEPPASQTGPKSPVPLSSVRDRLAASAKLSNAALVPETPRPARLTLEMPAVGSAEPRVARATEVPGGAKGVPPAERLNLAMKKMMQSDFPAAIRDVERLLVDEPGHLDGLLTLGNLYSLTGRIVEAREAFAQALTREPLCVEARVFGGVAALQAGQLAEARSELSKALFLEPTLAIGHYLLAQVQERTKDREGARRSYRNAIAQLRFPQRPLAGHYPDIPDSPEAISRVARYALAALEEEGH